MRSQMTPGLCSVTLRSLSADGVIETAIAAGLASIEWGADRHVVPGNLVEATRVGNATRAAGVSVAALGSYFRAGDLPDPAAERLEWETVLSAARAVGAPRIRVWAGARSSAEANSGYRRRVSDTLKRCVDTSGEIVVATEFHDATLTDTAESVLALLEDVPGLQTYWQPAHGLGTPDAVAELELVFDHLAAVHVFSWWPTAQNRLPLIARADLWHAVFDLLHGRARPLDCLLEFLPHDDPALLVGEADSLFRLMRQGGRN